MLDYKEYAYIIHIQKILTRNIQNMVTTTCINSNLKALNALVQRYKMYRDFI